MRTIGGGWDFDLSRLPATGERTGGIFAGLFFIVFACLWGGIPTVALLQNGADILEQPAGFAAFLFPIAAVGLILLGLHFIRFRKSITIDRYFVAVEQRGLFGVREWREPLSNYLGVLKRVERRSSRKSKRTYYIVDLKHRTDDKKTINLYTARSDRELREKWEQFARQLQVPALEQGADGPVARKAEDLDKTVTELLEEGKISVDRRALAGEAEGVSIVESGDEVIVTRTRPAISVLGGLFAMAFPLIFVFVGFSIEDAFGWIFGFAGILFEVISVVAVVWDRIARQRLVVTPDAIRRCEVAPWGETKGRSLPVSEIETIDLARRRDDDGKRLALHIVSDARTLKFGAGLPRQTLETVRNTVLETLDQRH